MIFRTCVWFSPFQAPIRTEAIADETSILESISS